MELATPFKRAALRYLWDTAQRTRTSLIDALQCALNESFEFQRSGLVPASTAGNGESVTFSRVVGGWSPVSAIELYGEFIDRYETTQSDLDDGATDCAIFAGMLDRLTGAKEVYEVFCGMRRP